jgi:hypothetical protein
VIQIVVEIKKWILFLTKDNFFHRVREEYFANKLEEEVWH